MIRFLGLLIVMLMSTVSNNAYSQCDSTELNKADINMPNVFTPDIDGYNDGFNAYGDCITSIHKKIYNRWGELLFESVLKNELWNGRTTTGNQVPEGTYFYIFDVTFNNMGTSESKTYKGSLTLIR